MDSENRRESFRSLLLRHRGRTGLIQRDLAAQAGVSLRSVQDWETGATLPGAERLQGLVRALLENGGLTAGRETAEARELWAAAELEAPRLRTPFDDVWFADLLASHAPPTGAIETATEPHGGRDWGEAPDTAGFVGRRDELQLLQHWVLEERCRVVAVLGFGGIGKTSLAAMLAQTVAPNFERVYWRSLRNAPPVSEWVAGAIGFLSEQQQVAPADESELLTALMQCFRTRRCLLVLDNSETLFEPGQGEGKYRAGMEGYGRVLQTVGEASHQSCLVLTSREAPPELAVLGGGVRSLELGGLGVDEARQLLSAKQLAGSGEEWNELTTRFGGNGLALELVGETIREVLGGDIALFLQGATERYLFGGVRRLLAEQIERSSALEQHVLRVLAVEREPVTIGRLRPDLRQAGTGVLEAVEGLRRRSLIEHSEAAGTRGFMLQSVVLEYVTDRLVSAVADEIERGAPAVLVEQPLMKAQAKEYVRQTQERLIGEPILQRLRTQYDEQTIEERLLALLQTWREPSIGHAGYGPGNAVNLLRLLRGNLRAVDLSRLAIRQAYLAQIDAQDASLAHADLSDSVLAEAFEFPGYLALDGDGELLAAGTTTGEVWMWRVADRTPLWRVQGHSGTVYGIALSADGRLVVSGAADGKVRVWEARSGRPLGTLSGHVGTIRGVAVSADGHLVASGGGDGSVCLWNSATGELLASLEGNTAGVWSVALSADGTLVASSGGDALVRVWHTGTHQRVATLEGHVGPVCAVALSADGRLVAGAGLDGTARVWETETWVPRATLSGHVGSVLAAAFTADGRQLVTGGLDATVRVWDTRRGLPVATLQGHTSAVYTLALPQARSQAVPHDGEFIASGGADGSLRLWTTSGVGDWRQMATLQGHTSSVRAVALSADGRLVAAGGGDGTVRLWDAHSGGLLETLEGHTGTVWDVALAGDGHLVASGSSDGTVRLWQSAAGGVGPTTMTSRRLSNETVLYCVALSGEGDCLAGGGVDGVLRVWDTTTRLPPAVLTGHTGALYCVAFSANGELLASGGTDGTLRVWERRSSASRAVLQGHTGTVFGAAFSVDATLLVSCGEDGSVRIWDPNSGVPLATLVGHAGAVYGVALSADGRLAASGGADGAVRLWEVDGDRSRSLEALHGHGGVVRDVSLSVDGQIVASASFDGTLKIWSSSDGACLRTLRPERRYERLNITGLTGVTDGQRAALHALGAVDHDSRAAGR